MNLITLVQRTRALLNDVNSTLFQESDIRSYVNEGIDRIQMVIPELHGIKHLSKNEDVPMRLPSRYHHLLVLYAVSRCSSIEQRHYEASLNMNEFETKLDQLLHEVNCGETEIQDEWGNGIYKGGKAHYVEDAYSNRQKSKKRWC